MKALAKARKFPESASVFQCRNVYVRGGWQRGLEPSLHDRTSKEIWPSRTVY